MIVIYSISTDGTTTEVINWLKSKTKIPVLRINTDLNNVAFVRYDEQEREFLISKNNKVFNLFDAKSFWYRKGGHLYLTEINTEIKPYDGLYAGLLSKLKSEQVSLNHFIKRFLERASTISLGSAFNASPNKLNVLDIAKDHGLATPITFIIDNKNDLRTKISQYGELITKAISDGIYLFNRDYSFYSYTELVNENVIKSLPDKFFPSLFQVKIKKKFEVRTFLINREFYSMAIFSQRNRQTEIDFRKYDGKKPNRCIPFVLPNHIKAKLLKVAGELKLNTGSVDLIVDSHDQFIFLEINPVGQFSMVSYPCNYYLEEKVADYLIP
ncbi:Hypothetical protein C900_05765 [Fulvivirga imtechensis AK7]|uniref:Grasp-with-spasm system ATP-grasp peptide maturase n=1 Tax=Fulvivirga imtechensis AK7 TaxID=1237149 RepID=L8JWG9_9BACT|nr:grasp-with-spasm system ATP-grasp peptide maturase [Fulvivirga imtechensis]ELR73130.1 Hypothetical protein C900_05765 [Fulvivirga imtechensis AK7]